MRKDREYIRVCGESSLGEQFIFIEIGMDILSELRPGLEEAIQRVFSPL